MCFATCGLEFLCAGWGATFLVEARGVSVELGAKLIILYYAGVTLGRLLAGFFADRLGNRKIIYLAEGAAFAGILLLLIPSTACSVAGLFLLGFNAVLAPNILYLPPESFGVKISQSVTGLEMAAMYVGVMGLPAGFGLLTGFLPVSVYPVFVAVVFAVLLWSTFSLSATLRRPNKSVL